VTSRKDEHLAKAQNTILIRWSLVLNFLIYLSEFVDFADSDMKFELIREISCPKTEFPKKCVVLFIVGFFLSETKLLKKRKEDENLPSLNFY